jgi:peptidoglycan/xylan/chitin deacetylase (PgdA/CDA1 family)
MSKKNRSLLTVLLCPFILWIMGCTNIVRANNINTTTLPTLYFGVVTTPVATPFLPMTDTPTAVPPTFTPSPAFTPTETFTPLPTDTPIPTDTSTPTESPEYIWNPAGEVTAPILMYHHVSNDFPGFRYSVSVDDFRSQMQALRNWGYTSITATDLANAILYGGDLPNRPVVITFDDGYEDVYQNALSIMNELGFIGTIYIYVDHAGLSPYISFEHISELAENGWEIGSHSMSHMDLSKNHSIIDYEVNQSRWTLENMIGVSVDTFAYPYGMTDFYVMDYVRNSGYHAGMGLGLNYTHTLDKLYNLDRIEVYNDYSLSTFAELLPWSD